MRLGSFQLPNGASLSYAEYGTSTGNPVLLFHGLVGSICSEGMEESLCGLPVRVIALARPGYGASDYFDMDCVADWGRLLAEFWDHLELWSFDIVGISAGAPYAYSLAALYPDRIGTLYINSGIPAVCFPNVLAQYPAQDAALYRAFRGMSRQEAGQALYDSYLPLFPEAALQSRDFRDSMGSDLRNIGQEAKLQEAPWGFKLSEVRCPVVLLHGTADSEVPYTLESLMEQVSMVFQRVYLFADTVENNIKFGCPGATHKQVVEAAKKACCHDFISALPDGYNTVIGEGGATLSGGEKQRISIARCLLKDAPIVIFDEATANVDPENEDQLQKAMEALTREKTVLMIAHRLKTVRGADQILVVDQGRVVQKGTHDELIRQAGIYRDFVSERTESSRWTL